MDGEAMTRFWNVANYEIVEETPARIVLRDIGPWDKYMTITNAAESVIEWFAQRPGGIGCRRVFYYDSAGELDELLVKDEVFAGFKYCPKLPE
jgi:hypothetical protein